MDRRIILTLFVLSAVMLVTESLPLNTIPRPPYFPGKLPPRGGHLFPPTCVCVRSPCPCDQNWG